MVGCGRGRQDPFTTAILPPPRAGQVDRGVLGLALPEGHLDGRPCLLTNVIDWDQEALWRTCTMFMDPEFVFRSLKSEFGLCPVCHQTQGRSDSDLFITVVACQLAASRAWRTASWASSMSPPHSAARMVV